MNTVTPRFIGSFFMHFLSYLAVIAAILSSSVYAASWPPLKAPDPLKVDWVLKQTLIRYPDVHAHHRRYLAALERAVAAERSGRATAVDQQDTELARLRAVEHHLELEWQARHAYYDYWLAARTADIVTERKRLWDAYIPAGKARMHKGADDPRDFALEGARLYSVALAHEQERAQAALHLNVLLDRSLDETLTLPDPGPRSALPPDRQALVEQALKDGIGMRLAHAEVARANALVEALRAGKRKDETLEAALHELAGVQDHRRAVGALVMRDVMAAHDRARARAEAMTLYERDVMPRLDQIVKMTVANYQVGRVDIARLLDAHDARFNAELETIKLRAEYEKALADLARTLGRLSPEQEQKLARRPLNIGGSAK